ncbi:unnamed protein product, partial [Rotaria sp. Silwood1]
DLKQRETRWSTTINRLKERIEPLAYENAEVKQEKDIIELQQTKRRPKSTVPTTSKTQSLPKTMVARNSEPPIKPKITSNGRRTPTTIIEPAIIISERTDSGNDGNDEDSNRFD